MTGKLHCDRHRPIAAESPHIEGREIGAKHVTVVRVKVCGATQDADSIRSPIIAENRILSSMTDSRPSYYQGMELTVSVL